VPQTVRRLTLVQLAQRVACEALDGLEPKQAATGQNAREDEKLFGVCG
jgi:hypothetical protein